MELHFRGNLGVFGLNFAPENTGNAPYTSGFCSYFVANIQVVFCGMPHYPQWKVWPGYSSLTRRESIGDIPLVRLRHFVPKNPKGLKRLISEVSFGLRLVLTARFDADHLLFVSPAMISSFLAMHAARLKSPRSTKIVWVQDLYARGMIETGETSTIAIKVVSFMEKSLLRHASHVFVIHEIFREWLVSDYKIDPDRITIVRNWSHLTIPDRLSSNRGEFGWDESHVVVLHTGNMGVKQGLENVVKAAKFVRPGSKIRFVLMGDGSERERLVEMGNGVEALEFRDPVSNESYVRALLAADILLVNELHGVSSMSVPSKLTSYMQAGKPIVAATSLVGATAKEIHSSKAGVVVEAGNPEALLEAVESLAVDKTSQQRFGEAGKKYAAQNLAYESVMKTFAQTFLRLEGDNF